MDNKSCCIIIMLEINEMNEQHVGQSIPTINYATNQNLTPYGPPPPLSANAFQACNQGIANGFGAMFFNMRDPNFRQTNQPVKKEASLHVALAIATALFIAGLAIGGAGYKNYLEVGGVIGVMVGCWFFYVLIALCYSDLRAYLHNTKRNAEYEYTYNKMVQGKGFFKFWIQCYHYVTTRTKNGGTSRRKVVTHTANQVFAVSASFDESGQIGNIFDEKNYIFLHYLKRYYFTDDASQNNFVAAFNNFVHRNTRDQYQSYTQVFDIEGYEEFAGFTPMGEASRTIFTFYLFTLLGMGLPYACLFERFVSRYEVGLLKRLTV